MGILGGLTLYMLIYFEGPAMAPNFPWEESRCAGDRRCESSGGTVSRAMYGPGRVASFASSHTLVNHHVSWENMVE